MAWWKRGNRSPAADAAEELRRPGDERAVPELVAALAGEERPDIATIVAALGRIGGTEARTALVAELGKSRAWHREPHSDTTLPCLAETAIANALVAVGGPRALLDALGEVMTSPAHDRFVRAEAAGELAQIAWRARAGHGLTVRRGSPPLAPADRTRMTAPLTSALRDGFWMVRERAVVALGRLGDSGALPLLIVMLDDEHDRVRYFTARALGDLGDRRAVEPLRHAVRKDPSMGVAVDEALAKLQAGGRWRARPIRRT